jgi:hypothetical protein
MLRLSLGRTVIAIALSVAAACRAPHPPASGGRSGVRVETIDGKVRYTNRLIDEHSPYLQLHAHNPVDWYAWGPEAFDRASPS